MMKKLQFMLFLVAIASASPALAGDTDPERWGDYLDFAYVYSSAEPDALRSRLEEYGREAGVSLDDYIANFLIDPLAPNADADETTLRRRAIAHLLQYLATRDPSLIDLAVEQATKLSKFSDSYQSRYWKLYIDAHRALERGNSADFVEASLSLWMRVVVPLEAPFETLEALSLSQSQNTGFVSALPYVFENVSRLILIRSQEMGLSTQLDPLGALVRLLAENRVGMHPDVIPQAASSKGYLDRIVSRLDGSESDAGSLTFTLLLFEAGKFHEQARGLLAQEGFSEATVKAIDITSGAYQRSLDQARTAQGRAAVYSRVLRQLGEIDAAKQRLGVDPYVDSPFDIEGAISVYQELFEAREFDDWKDVGFRRIGREAYYETMRGLWEEIQEASLNSADYYLARSLAAVENSDEYVRSAAQTYFRYLSFFERYVDDAQSDVIPDSAYFAAYEAAKGYGDAFLNFASRAGTNAEMEVVTQRYIQAIRTYPFDAGLWPSLAVSLERIGRSAEFLGRARPIADRIARSRHVDSWIRNQKAASRQIEILRRALTDDLVLMYLGFAASSNPEELFASLDVLRQERDQLAAKLAWLTGSAAPHSGQRVQMGPAAPAPAGQPAPINMTREIAQTKLILDRLQRKIDARTKALPLYLAALKTDGLIRELRSQRDHPVHTLLRRIYNESRS